MAQIIQEWPDENFWKTAFEKFEVIWSASPITCPNYPKKAWDQLSKKFGCPLLTIIIDGYRFFIADSF